MKKDQSSQEEKQPLFGSLHNLHTKVKDGTYKEILDDWRWIFTYSKRYKGAILFYTLLGLFSTSMERRSGVLKSSASPL